MVLEVGPFLNLQRSGSYHISQCRQQDGMLDRSQVYEATDSDYYADDELVEITGDRRIIWINQTLTKLLGGPPAPF